MQTFKTSKAMPVSGNTKPTGTAMRKTASTITLGNKRARTVLKIGPLVFMNNSGAKECRSLTLGSGGAVCTVLKQNAFCGLSAFMNTLSAGKEAAGLGMEMACLGLEFAEVVD